MLPSEAFIVMSVWAFNSCRL
uniref:Uncharacterized protein n=1 Tax=Rhizophora mucronata TaxID=61149 RepID=A0A2P2NI28_RHIMU